MELFAISYILLWGVFSYCSNKLALVGVIKIKLFGCLNLKHRGLQRCL